MLRTRSHARSACGKRTAPEPERRVRRLEVHGYRVVDAGADAARVEVGPNAVAFVHPRGEHVVDGRVGSVVGGELHVGTR